MNPPDQIEQTGLNPDEQWLERNGTPCDICGLTIHPDNKIVCVCGAVACSDCRVSCENCSAIICKSCAYEDGEGNKTCSAECANAYAVKLIEDVLK